jgi:ABC-type Na+ efflux pump permease subunit
MDLTMKTIFRALALLVMFGVFAAPVTMASATVEEQPHMKAVLEYLRLAKAALEQAEADKGGHRVAALKATDDAIHHTEEGIKFANHH